MKLRLESVTTAWDLLLTRALAELSPSPPVTPYSMVDIIYLTGFADGLFFFAVSAAFDRSPLSAPHLEP
jgi:hypothetical protein